MDKGFPDIFLQKRIRQELMRKLDLDLLRRYRGAKKAKTKDFVCG